MWETIVVGQNLQDLVFYETWEESKQSHLRGGWLFKESIQGQFSISIVFKFINAYDHNETLKDSIHL